jgi:hypothetical protein
MFDKGEEGWLADVEDLEEVEQNDEDQDKEE